MAQLNPQHSPPTRPEQAASSTRSLPMVSAITPLPSFVFFRRSEVMLYFEGEGAGNRPHSDVGDLLSTLRTQRIPIHPHHPTAGPSGRREPLVVRRGGRVHGVLHTVNLHSWLPEEERQRLEQPESATLTPQQTLAGGYEHVTETVAQLNEMALSGQLSWGNLRLTAATPNWLVGPLAGYDSGPAGRPVRPTRPSFDPATPPRFRSTAPGHSHLPFSGTGRRIRVATFDTWPGEFAPAFHPLGRIKACARNLEDGRSAAAGSGGPVANARLAAMGDGRIIPPERIYDFVHGVHNKGWAVVPFGCARVSEPPYDMADHGLFVADIINDIAPMAEIHVYRILNDNGIGDLDTLARAVQHAIDAATASEARLILNLSLGITPSSLFVQNVAQDPAAYYLTPEQVADDIAALTRPVPPPPPGQEYNPHSTVALMREGGLIDRKQNRFVGPLSVVQKLFDLVEADNVLAVAAAGNDSCGDVDRFNPRLPAAIDGVLAVSAFAGSDLATLHLADYSNTDDFFADNDGVGAFGGAVESSYAVEGNALVGLYSGEDLPPGSGTANVFGWAEWSGTSFATPVATGVAACLWSEDVTQSAKDIADALRSLSSSQPNDVLPLMQQ